MVNISHYLRCTPILSGITLLFISLQSSAIPIGDNSPRSSGPGISPRSISSLEITRLFTVGSGDNTKQSKSINHFNKDEPVIYVRFIYRQGKPGETITARWTFEDIEGHSGEFAKSQVKLKKTSDRGQFSFRPESSWRDGRYNVSLYDGNNQVADSIQFLVGDIKSAASAKISSVTQLPSKNLTNNNPTIDIENFAVTGKNVEGSVDFNWWLNKGREEWTDGELTKAINTIEEAKKRFPENETIVKMSKSMLLQKKILDDSLDKAKKLINKRKLTSANRYLTKAGLINKKYLPYIEVLDMLAEPSIVLEPPEPIIAGALRDSGIARFREGILSDDDVVAYEGINLLEQAVLKDYTNRTVWIDLADAYLASDKVLLAAQAIGICETLMVEEKENKDLLLSRIASGYLQIDNLDAALAIAAKAVELAPDKRLNQAAAKLANIAGIADKMAPAIDVLTMRAKVSSNPGFTQLMLAALYELEGNKFEAMRALNASLKTLPEQGRLFARAKADLERLSK